MTDRLRETDAQPLEQWRMDRLYRDLDGVKQAEILGWKADLTWGEVASLIATIERQGKALRAVAELAQRSRRDIDPANQVDKHEPFYDEGIEDSADELEETLKAALAQTEPQI